MKLNESEVTTDDLVSFVRNQLPDAAHSRVLEFVLEFQPIRDTVREILRVERNFPPGYDPGDDPSPPTPKQIEARWQDLARRLYITRGGFAVMWPINGCPVCGLAPNDFCTEYHIPYARERATELELGAQRYALKLVRYEESVRPRIVAGNNATAVIVIET